MKIKKKLVTALALLSMLAVGVASAGDKPTPYLGGTMPCPEGFVLSSTENKCIPLDDTPTPCADGFILSSTEHKCIPLDDTPIPCADGFVLSSTEHKCIALPDTVNTLTDSSSKETNLVENQRSEEFNPTNVVPAQNNFLIKSDFCSPMIVTDGDASMEYCCNPNPVSGGKCAAAGTPGTYAGAYYTGSLPLSENTYCRTQFAPQQGAKEPCYEYSLVRKMDVDPFNTTKKGETLAAQVQKLIDKGKCKVGNDKLMGVLKCISDNKLMTDKAGAAALKDVISGKNKEMGLYYLGTQFPNLFSNFASGSYNKYMWFDSEQKEQAVEDYSAKLEGRKAKAITKERKAAEEKQRKAEEAAKKKQVNAAAAVVVAASAAVVAAKTLYNKAKAKQKNAQTARNKAQAAYNKALQEYNKAKQSKDWFSGARIQIAKLKLKKAAATLKKTTASLKSAKTSTQKALNTLKKKQNTLSSKKATLNKRKAELKEIQARKPAPAYSDGMPENHDDAG